MYYIYIYICIIYKYIYTDIYGYMYIYNAYGRYGCQRARSKTLAKKLASFSIMENGPVRRSSNHAFRLL